jgi:hypothetical protein
VVLRECTRQGGTWSNVNNCWGKMVVKKMQDIHPGIQWELGPPNYLCDKWELTICAGSSSFLRERAPQ